jgi:hypothetical protein
LYKVKFKAVAMPLAFEFFGGLDAASMPAKQQKDNGCV